VRDRGGGILGWRFGVAFFGCFGLVDLIWELEGFEGEEVR
jgi:hypothetical protein